MIAFLYHWFDWPNGAVLTNLIATAVCVGLAGWKLLRKMHQIHEHLRLIHAHQIANTPKPRQTRKA